MHTTVCLFQHLSLCFVKDNTLHQSTISYAFKAMIDSWLFQHILIFSSTVAKDETVGVTGLSSFTKMSTAEEAFLFLLKNQCHFDTVSLPTSITTLGNIFLMAPTIKAGLQSGKKVSVRFALYEVKWVLFKWVLGYVNVLHCEKI